MNTLTKPSFIHRFLHFELSPKQMMVATVVYFAVMLAIYLFCMFWVIKQILSEPEETIKVVGPVLVGSYIHKRFMTRLKPKTN
jgi:hypothetical protein